MTVTTRVRVRGVVQGVGYRYYAQHQARAFGITGWVRNLPDGSVEAVARGNSEAVSRFVEWMRQGPSSARVEGADVDDEVTDERFDHFDIR